MRTLMLRNWRPTGRCLVSTTHACLIIFLFKIENRSFEAFHAHFKRYAFYGVMICLHFLPWMLSSEEECAKISHLFETNLRGEEFRRVSIEIGGDAVNMRLLEVLRHACKMGYMDEL